MAQFNHRIDLKDTKMPMLSSELGRTVLVSNNKNTPTSESPNEPEILYMHNVMPTKRGLQSVGFKEIVAAPTGGDATTAFERVVKVYSVATDALATAWVADKSIVVGKRSDSTTEIYVARYFDAVWTKLTVVGFSQEITVANVSGKSYVLVNVNSVGFFYNNGLSYVSTAFIGSPLGQVYGITNSFGYLIAWGATVVGFRDQRVAWSSLLNPLDLAASAITGAGTALLELAKGYIRACVPNSTGFIVYCQYNLISATYTGNKQYPFKFTSIENSTGIANEPTDSDTSSSNYLDLIAEDSDSYGHFSFGGVSGLQLVNSQSAKPILPEVSDFFALNIVEDFDETTKQLSVTAAVSGKTLHKKLFYVSSRYLVISYGLTELTHALIYDTALDRVGKIKYTHVAAYTHGYHLSTIKIRTISKESIAFVDKTGLVKVLSFNAQDTVRTGALILGKYQYHRDRMLHLQRIVAENIDAADTFTLTDSVSLDGRNEASQVVGTETAGTVGYREYYFPSTVGKNHSLIFIGEFIMNSLELLFTLGGRR